MKVLERDSGHGPGACGLRVTIIIVSSRLRQRIGRVTHCEDWPQSSNFLFRLWHRLAQSSRSRARAAAWSRTIRAKSRSPRVADPWSSARLRHRVQWDLSVWFSCRSRASSSATFGGIEEEVSLGGSGESIYTLRIVGVMNGRRCGGRTRGFRGAGSHKFSKLRRGRQSGRTDVVWGPTHWT